MRSPAGMPMSATNAPHAQPWRRYGEQHYPEHEGGEPFSRQRQSECGSLLSVPSCSNDFSKLHYHSTFRRLTD
jgi:hypothetical protein